MRKLVIAALIAVAALACGGEDATDVAASPEGSAPPVQAGGDCHDASKAGGQADLEMQDFKFAPPCLIISTSQGFRLHNEGSVPHNFSIEGTGLDVDVQPNEENNTEATGLEAGTYTLFCKFHRESNDMEGELRIKSA